MYTVGHPRFYHHDLVLVIVLVSRLGLLKLGI